MPEFTFNEGSLDLPGGWEDRSVIALSFPSGAPKPEASFAITRDRSATGDSSLASYVDRQLVDMAKSCPKFELVRRDRIALEGSNAETMEFSWRSPDGTFVRQTQTILLLIPLFAIVLPLIKPVPAIYVWSIRRRLTYWYRHLAALERALEHPNAANHIRARRAELERIDAAVRRIRIPIYFADQVYDLRGHIDFVRQRLALLPGIAPAVAAE